MQNKMSNRSLGFNFTFEAYKAQECRVIRLTKSILAKVRIGQLDDIRFVRLCAGGAVFGISTLRPASIRFFTSGDVEVWSIEGDGPTLRRELGLLIECKVSLLGQSDFSSAEFTGEHGQTSGSVSSVMGNRHSG